MERRLTSPTHAARASTTLFQTGRASSIARTDRDRMVDGVYRFLVEELELPHPTADSVVETVQSLITSGRDCDHVDENADTLSLSETVLCSAALRTALDAIGKDRSAETFFLERLRDRLCRIARRVVSSGDPGTPEIAEDLTQDVLLRLWSDNYRRLRQWQGQCTFGRYLTIIVRNAVIDGARRRSLPLVSLDDRVPDGCTGHVSIDIFDRSPGPEERVLLRLERDRIWNAVNTLPGRQRELVRRHYYHDQNCRQIANDTGVSASHAAVILFRARRTLRKLLEQSNDQTG